MKIARAFTEAGKSPYDRIAFRKATSEIEATLDPAAFLIGSASMLAVGVIAALIPASRATRVDPTTALRAE